MPGIGAVILVTKRNALGQEVLTYTGTLLRREHNIVVVEARFGLPDIPLVGETLRTGDRFIETYFTDRWYNVFEIHDRDDDRLKGWYCNIGRPAFMEADNSLSYVDLALDLWVAPDGPQTVLDEEEFRSLDLDDETRARACLALEELQAHFTNKQEPGLFK